MAARLTIYPNAARVQARESSTEQRIDIAQAVADAARSHAPVHDGDYRDGIAVQIDGTHVSVVDNDPDAVFKEYGTSDTPAHASLTDSARQYGRYSGWRPRGA